MCFDCDSLHSTCYVGSTVKGTSANLLATSTDMQRHTYVLQWTNLQQLQVGWLLLPVPDGVCNIVSCQYCLCAAIDLCNCMAVGAGTAKAGSWLRRACNTTLFSVGLTVAVVMHSGPHS